MQFWMPVVSELKGKEYKTLADVPEGPRCLITFGNSELLVGRRVGGLAVSCTPGDVPDPRAWASAASKATFHEAIDPLPTPPKPTIGSIPDDRCFYRGNPEIVEWKHGEYILSFGAGKKMTCTHIRYYSEAEQVTILNLEMQLQDVPVTKASD